MAYNAPIRCEFSSGRFYVEVDLKKCDCKQEPAHCHVTLRGRRIGQVWLDSLRFKDLPGDMSHSEVNDVLSDISSRRYELKRAYENNGTFGAD